MNKFIWYDLMTPDLATATQFYESVVGWNIADSGMPGMNYSILSAGDTMVGGMMQNAPDQKDMNPPWQGHIYSLDVDRDCERVTEKGGHVHRAPADIPGIGRFAVVSDPGGASFILFKPNSTEQPNPAAPGTPGHIGWRELHAWDGEKAMQFYGDMFGWKQTSSMDMGAMGQYRLFTADGKGDDGGLMTKTPDMLHSTWLYYFNVDGIDAAAQRVKSAGGKVAMGPHEVPGGMWIIQAFDPHGKLFGLLSQKR